MPDPEQTPSDAPACLIRRLARHDAASYRELRLRALRDHPDMFGRTYAEFARVTVGEIEEWLRAAEPSEDDCMLGAFAPELVGMLRLRRDDDARKRHKAHVSQMYVAPEQRGHGLGRQLLCAALEIARAMPGLRKVMLSVGPHNAAARRLYASLGFISYGLERQSELVNGVFIDEEAMELWLDAGT